MKVFWRDYSKAQLMPPNTIKTDKRLNFITRKSSIHVLTVNIKGFIGNRENLARREGETDSTLENKYCLLGLKRLVDVTLHYKGPL